MQGLLLLKLFFSLNYQFLYWSTESLLKAPCGSETLGLLEDLQGTCPGGRVAAWIIGCLLKQK